MRSEESLKADPPTPSASETDTSPVCQRYYAASKRIPIDVKRYCGMCRQHGLQLRTRGHVCAYKDCTCEKCALVRSRRGVMSEQIRLRRAQDKRFQRTNKPQEADLIPINAAQLALSKGGRATRGSASNGSSGPCYFCQKCKNHGIIAHKKQHKAECEFADCTCAQCALIATRRSIDQDIKMPRLTTIKRTPCTASPSGSVESAISPASADNTDLLAMTSTRNSTEFNQISLNEYNSISKSQYLADAMDTACAVPSIDSPSFSITSTCSPSTSTIMPLQVHDNTPSPTWGIPSPLDSVHSNDMFGYDKLGLNNNANIISSTTACSGSSLLGSSNENSKNELNVSNFLLRNLMANPASMSSAFAPLVTLPQADNTRDVLSELSQSPLFSQLAALPPVSRVFDSSTNTAAAAAAAAAVVAAAATSTTECVPMLFTTSASHDNTAALTRKSSADVQLLSEILYIQQQRQQLLELQKQQQQQQLLNEQREEQLRQLSEQICREQQALAYLKEQQEKQQQQQNDNDKLNDVRQQQIQMIVALARQHALVAAAAATVTASTNYE